MIHSTKKNMRYAKKRMGMKVCMSVLLCYDLSYQLHILLVHAYSRFKFQPRSRKLEVVSIGFDSFPSLCLFVHRIKQNPRFSLPSGFIVILLLGVSILSFYSCQTVLHHNVCWYHL